MKIKVTTKCDWASHLLPLNERDKESIETIVTNGGFPEPDMKLKLI